MTSALDISIFMLAFLASMMYVWLCLRANGNRPFIVGYAAISVFLTYRASLALARTEDVDYPLGRLVLLMILLLTTAWAVWKGKGEAH